MSKITYLLQYKGDKYTYRDCVAKLQKWFDARPQLSRDDYLWGSLNYDGVNNVVIVFHKKEGSVHYEDIFEPPEDSPERLYNSWFRGWKIPTPRLENNNV